MKLTHVVSRYKTTLPIKNSISLINILYADSFKSIPVYYDQLEKKFKSTFKYVCIELDKE